jgi:putative nucleotidyltransferase with HDIG domain
MIKTRTLAGLGAALNEDVPNLVEKARRAISIAPLAADPSTAFSLSDALSRLCLSMTLGKPVGLSLWARRESGRVGRAQSLDLAAAALHAITQAGVHSDVDQARLCAFLDVLMVEIERAAVNDRAYHPPTPVEVHATNAILAMLSERDEGLCCHSKATAEWTRRLANAMHLSSESVEFISLCALLHDVGKVSTPDHVLLKEGGLTSDEWVIMREHAAAGERILKEIPPLAGCAVIVRAHHERYDGTGYPDALVGIEIPFEARVLAVADAFHAMISERPYRQSIAPRDALDVIAAGRGTQWDPDVVDAMLGMFKRDAVVTARVGERVSSA